ncbi:solute:sodium symporter family transporter [Virgibacillus dokdonensis]|uniref:Solute:sodium symporter family transporter n=1 Tax=Virgibacillus dokdonensis TaxID=302167 RepID=A0A3E0WRF8_9BACI|nr:solute:sodium symporter family transporter [Virgibacillus dokdonensis]RFA34783.1 solute:sodium symporter family transporter [Virgibacillus dokdonensis]
MNAFALVTFVVIIALVWLYAWRKSRNIDISTAEGFFMGGHSLTGLSIAGTIIMTNLSTEQLVGQNGQSYAAGMEVMAWEVTSAIAIVLLALVFLPRYMKYGVNTISDFIEIRYDTFTKRLISILFMFTYLTSFLPVVLYSGALVFNKLFNIDEILGVDPLIAVAICAAFIGAVGVLYLLMGGLSLSAFSDTIYGFGLLTGGILILILGIVTLGNGSAMDGVHFIRENTAEKLNAWGAIDSDYVPWPTLMLGMLFNNLYFWCCNQMIVQKALGGKSLKEGQKGALYVAFFKVFGALFLVLPGIVAFNMFDGGIANQDDAYPSLVSAVLPEWAYGIFAAVIFGAILSSFVGSLNSTATLFSLDFYKPIFNKDATDRQVARMGKIVTVIVGFISIIIAPLIAFAPTGLYNVIQEFNGLYSLPLLVIILFGFWNKRVTAQGAKITFSFHLVVYIAAQGLLAEINYLYIFSVLFLLDCFVLWMSTRINPLKEPFQFQANLNKVDMTPWKHVKWVSAIALLLVVIMYTVFSPVVLAN